ncbi:MAG: hypothetical protein M1817_006311 [Caeruleum heppii]|nr:MAG: hypothetical protein M1817_006311 [Caeruleum heppii]
MASSPSAPRISSRAEGIRLTLFGDSICTTYSYRISLDAGVDSCSPIPLSDLLDMTAMKVTEFDAPGVRLSVYSTSDCSDDPLDTVTPDQAGEVDRNTCMALAEGANKGKKAKAYRVIQTFPKGQGGAAARNSSSTAFVEASSDLPVALPSSPPASFSTTFTPLAATVSSTALVSSVTSSTTLSTITSSSSTTRSTMSTSTMSSLTTSSSAPPKKKPENGADVILHAPGVPIQTSSV